MCGKGSSGGGGFGSLAPIQQSTTQASPQAIQAYTKALGLADVAAAQPFQKYSTDPNAFVAPLTGTQQQAIGGLYGAQGAYQPYYQGAGALTAAAGTTSTPQVVGQYMNPFMQQVVNPVQQALQQQQGQQLAQQQAEAIRGGAFGGERAGLQRQVLRGQQQLGMGQALSPLYQQGYGQALQAAQGDLARQLQAGQALGALGTGAQTAALQAPQALLGAGTLEQQTQQAGLSALYNQFLQERAYPYQQAQFYSNVAGGLGPLLGQQTFQSQAQNPFGMFLSEPGAKMGVDSYADGGFAQDRSQPDVVGKTFDDQNIYAYRYKDGGPAHLGLMADEVQQSHPEAVGYAPTGDRMVDYAAATDAAARMGGAVKDTGDYARGGYAIGGHLSYIDPSDPTAADRRRMEALLASHRGGLSGAASEYGPSGQSYVTQKTYVPAGTVRAGQQLQHARFEPVQSKGGLGSALETGEKLGGLLEKGSKAYDMFKNRNAPTAEKAASAYRAQVAASPDQLIPGVEEVFRASGGIVPTSYIPEDVTGEVRASQPLRPAEFDERDKDKESGLSKLMSVGEKALDVGIKYGPLLAQGATMLAPMSEPRMKTGVRSGYAEGGESNFIDNLINALSGHGYITGETWERPQREVATREPMDLHPAARSKGVIPNISPEQYRYERRMAERNMAPRLTEDQYQQELAMGRQNMMSHGGRTGYATVGGVRPSNDDVFERGILGAESGHRQFDEEGRTLRSPKGAAGIAQVMPGTAPEAARLAGLPFDEQRYLTDADYNEALGRAYYNKQLETFGSKDKAAAAYNAGPGALRNALRRAEREGGDYLSYLPAETRAFVPKVMGLAGARGTAGEGQSLSARDIESAPAIRSSDVSGIPAHSLRIPASDLERQLVASATPKKEGLGAAQPQGAPAQEEGLGDFLTSEKFVIPALAGLGTAVTSAMSAPTTSLGAALAGGAGAGIAAGAKQYSDTAKGLEERRKLHEEGTATAGLGRLYSTEALEKLRGLPIWVDPKTNLRMVFLADGTVMDYNKWAETGGALLGTEEAAMAAKQLGLQLAGKETTGYPGGVVPFGEKAATVTEGPITTPGGQADREPSTIPEGQTVPIKDLAKEVAETKQPAIREPSKMPLPIGVNYGKGSDEFAKEDLKAATAQGSDVAEERSKKYMERIDQAAASSRSSKIFQLEAAKLISRAARAGGFDAPGATSEERASILNGLNTLARGLGITAADGSSPFGEKDSRVSMLDKIAKLNAEAIAKGASQPGLGTLEKIISAMPGEGQSPESGAYNAASNVIQTQKSIDQQAHANYYGSKTRNNYAYHGQAFERDNPDSAYNAQERAFQRLILDPQGAEIIERIMSDPGKYSPKVIDGYLKKRVNAPPGMSRFFGGV